MSNFLKKLYFMGHTYTKKKKERKITHFLFEMETYLSVLYFRWQSYEQGNTNFSQLKVKLIKINYSRVWLYFFAS